MSRTPITHSILFLALVACEAPPHRLVAGVADTVVVNSVTPTRVPVHVFDARGHALPDTGVRFQWTSGISLPLSPRGVVTCTQTGDATIHASLGPLVTQVQLRCRPVRTVLGGGEMNFVIGDPPENLLFAPVDSAGRPVKLITARVEYDTTIVTLDGWRIHPRAPGSTNIFISIGDGLAHWFVTVYERADNLEGIRQGQSLAVAVRLAGGEMHTVPLPPSPPNYFVGILPDRDTLRTPRLTFDNANCLRSDFPKGYYCFSLPGATAIAYHPPQHRPTEEWRGTIVARRERP